MSGPDDKRAIARELASRAVAEGEPLRWFEELYDRAARGETDVPWADLQPNPLLVKELPGLQVSELRTLVVGCGYGDDAALLAAAGASVTAFDIAPSAVARCRERYPDLSITWTTGDALEPDAAWRRAFDLVVEIFTLQVLPPAERKLAGDALGGCVAVGGRLLVLCRGRDVDEPEGAMPWPLTVPEVRALATDGLALERWDDFLDDEQPPVRRLLAVLRRNR